MINSIVKMVRQSNTTVRFVIAFDIPDFSTTSRTLIGAEGVHSGDTLPRKRCHLFLIEGWHWSRRCQNVPETRSAEGTADLTRTKQKERAD